MLTKNRHRVEPAASTSATAAGSAAAADVAGSTAAGSGIGTGSAAGATSSVIASLSYDWLLRIGICSRRRFIWHAIVFNMYGDDKTESLLSDQNPRTNLNPHLERKRSCTKHLAHLAFSSAAASVSTASATFSGVVAWEVRSKTRKTELRFTV